MGEIKVSLAAIALLLSSSCSAENAVEAHKCGMNDASPGFLATARAMQSRSQKLTPRSQREGFVVPTYFHVVESRDKNGSVTSRMLRDQLSVLQDTYAPHKIQFELLATTHTVNDEWANTVQHPNMSLSLRKGGYDELNIYFQSGMGSGGLTGWCNFPVEDPANTGINGTSYYVYDGCHINTDTLPGGIGGGFHNLDNAGKTATHEVGHWLGLLHTFDGMDCGGEGDAISDTPAQSTATQGCPVDPPKDSCPDQPGVDPIHNYMDYASDACKTEFTPEQEDRMHDMFYTLRQGK